MLLQMIKFVLLQLEQKKFYHEQTDFNSRR